MSRLPTWRRLVALADRPATGWVLAAAGGVALVLGWFGVSGTPLVAKQLPYLVSGGLGGLALVFLGGLALGAGDVRRAAARLDRLEEQVGDLHRLLLVEAAAERPTADHAENGPGVAALPGGSSYHRRSCAILAGKGSEPLEVADAERRGLQPCKLCEPPARTADAAAGDPV